MFYVRSIYVLCLQGVILWTLNFCLVNFKDAVIGHFKNISIFKDICKTFFHVKHYFGELIFVSLISKIQSCKLYKITTIWSLINTDNFVLIAVPVFKLLSRKVLFINRKGKTRKTVKK